jgi:hypothetical protein
MHPPMTPMRTQQTVDTICKTGTIHMEDESSITGFYCLTRVTGEDLKVVATKPEVRKTSIIIISTQKNAQHNKKSIKTMTADLDFDDLVNDITKETASSFGIPEPPLKAKAAASTSAAAAAHPPTEKKSEKPKVTDKPTDQQPKKQASQKGAQTSKPPQPTQQDKKSAEEKTEPKKADPPKAKQPAADEPTCDEDANDADAEGGETTKGSEKESPIKLINGNPVGDHQVEASDGSTYMISEYDSISVAAHDGIPKLTFPRRCFLKAWGFLWQLLGIYKDTRVKDGILQMRLVVPADQATEHPDGFKTKEGGLIRLEQVNRYLKVLKRCIRKCTLVHVNTMSETTKDAQYYFDGNLWAIVKNAGTGAPIDSSVISRRTNTMTPLEYPKKSKQSELPKMRYAHVNPMDHIDDWEEFAKENCLTTPPAICLMPYEEGYKPTETPKRKESSGSGKAKEPVKKKRSKKEDDGDKKDVSDESDEKQHQHQHHHKRSKSPTDGNKKEPEEEDTVAPPDKVTVKKIIAKLKPNTDRVSKLQITMLSALAQDTSVTDLVTAAHGIPSMIIKIAHI